MDQPLLSPKNVLPPSEHKSNPKKSNNKQESSSKSKLRGQPSEILDPTLHSKDQENKPKSIPEVNEPELTAEEVQQVKTNVKSSKRQSLKAKESAKMSQRRKEMEKDEIKSNVLKNIEGSGKQLKTGNSKIQSNVRQYSAQNLREDPPQPETKKVTTTQSKRTKNAGSQMKAKTDIKQVREEGKQSIIGVAKRSKRLSSKENEPIKDHPSDQEENINESKKRKRKDNDDDFKPLSASNSEKDGRRSSLSSKTGKSRQKGNHQSEKFKSVGKKSSMKQTGVSSKKIETNQKQTKNKSKTSKSSMKSQAKSGVKKVKLDVSQK